MIDLLRRPHCGAQNDFRDRLETQPASLAGETIGPDEFHTYASTDHMGNFTDGIRTQRDTAAPVEAAHRSSTICAIGAICLPLGRKLRWDPRTERFLGDDEANRLLTRAPRDPWKL